MPNTYPQYPTDIASLYSKVSGAKSADNITFKEYDEPIQFLGTNGTSHTVHASLRSPTRLLSASIVEAGETVGRKDVDYIITSGRDGKTRGVEFLNPEAVARFKAWVSEKSRSIDTVATSGAGAVRS